VTGRAEELVAALLEDIKRTAVTEITYTSEGVVTVHDGLRAQLEETVSRYIEGWSWEDYRTPLGDD
jgi:hypothetical protein